MRIIKKAAAISAILSSTAFADTIAIGPKVGTQGIGVEGRMPVMENGFVRVGVNYFSLNRNYTIKNFGADAADDIGETLPAGLDFDVALKGKITLVTAPIMFDYHPFDNSGFRVSAGIAYNGNKVEIKGSVKPTLFGVSIPTDVNIPGFNKTLDDLIGRVKGRVKLGSSVAGLLTLGYDSSFVSQNPLSFAFEAGVMYTGKPKLTISTTGEFLGDEDVRAYLQKKAQKQFKSIDNYLQIFPVISLGVKYTF